jgi:hypothetical protein
MPLPTQNNTTYKHKVQTFMPLAGFEATFPTTQPNTYALDHVAKGTGYYYEIKKHKPVFASRGCSYRV